MMRKNINIISASLLLLVFAVGIQSCNKKDSNRERKEYIRVYASADSDEPLDRTWVSVEGGIHTYYIQSNVSFTADWQSEESSWASISNPKMIKEGLWSIDVSVKPIKERSSSLSGNANPVGAYTRRYGVLILQSPERYLGKYLVIEQGLESRIACNFSWLYGSVNPNATYNDVLMADWTTAQKNQGYTSTLIEGEENVWVYSKEGYVKLGNDHGAGADFFTPHTAAFQNDTLLVLSFKAVVQNGDVLPDYMGGTEPIVPMQRTAQKVQTADITDNNSLTVEVTGGGLIRDFVSTGGKSITFELPTYNKESESFPADMFDGGSFLVFIEGTEENPITVNTTIRFIAGSMKGSDEGPCNRVFLDDVFVYRQDLLLDEDLFLLNGGKSGADKIRGGKVNE